MRRFDTYLDQGIRKVFLANLGFVGALSVVQWFGLVWLSIPIGLISVALPGFNLALTLEQLMRRPDRRSTVWLWAAVYSLTLTPAATHIISAVLPLSSTTLLWPFVIWWAVTLLSVAGVYAAQRVAFSSVLPQVNWSVWREFGLLISVVLAVLIINLLIYPFIPEADGYTYLMALEQAQVHTPAALAIVEPRVFFMVLVRLLGELLLLDPYWIFKTVLPLGVLLLVIPVYLRSYSLIPIPWLRICAACAPLSFPIILQEVLISRPQSVLVFVLLPVLYLVGSLFETQPSRRQTYWLLSLLLVGLVGLKVHTLFLIILGIALFGLAVVWYPFAKRYPLDSLIFLIGLALLLWPWLAGTRLIEDVVRVSSLFIISIARNPFTFWFIDSYKNVDGAEVGWPGWSALLYYGYNLGVLLPMVIGLVAVSARPYLVGGFGRGYWPAWPVGGFFLFIAEFLPRFELAYLPDRAWLFVVLAACLGLPLLIQTVSATRRPILVGILVAATVLSIGAGTGLTYAKQGWVTKAEYKAVSFLRNEVSKNALLLGQGGNKPLVRYFGQRILITPPAYVFMSDDKNAVDQYLEEQTRSRDEAISQRQRVLDKFSSELGTRYDAYRRATSPEERRVTLEALQRTVITGTQALGETKQISNAYPLLEDVPLYIIYSDDKFESLYGQRSWYRNSNFYGAKLEKFSERYPVVYDQDGTTIWKVRD